MTAQLFCQHMILCASSRGWVGYSVSIWSFVRAAEGESGILSAYDPICEQPRVSGILSAYYPICEWVRYSVRISSGVRAEKNESGILSAYHPLCEQPMVSRVFCQHVVLCASSRGWGYSARTSSCVRAAEGESGILPAHRPVREQPRVSSPNYFRIFSCPISHATLCARFNSTKLLANLLTKPSVFLLLCQLYFL